MTPEAFRAAALALPGVTEHPHMDRRAYRARIIFATPAPDGLSANLKLTRDAQELHGERLPGAVEPVPGGWGRKGWTRVDLATVSETELAILPGAALRNGS